MLGIIVDYLHNARIPFRLSSYPSEEPQPIAAHRLPPGGMLVDSNLLFVNGRAVLAVFPFGEAPDLAAMAAVVGGGVVAGTNDELPDEFRRAQGPVPPLGQLFGMPIVLDERLARASILVFRAFSESAYFEIAYDEYALSEQPRLASFSSAGELGTGTTAKAAHP